MSKKTNKNSNMNNIQLNAVSPEQVTVEPVDYLFEAAAALTTDLTEISPLLTGDELINIDPEDRQKRYKNYLDFLKKIAEYKNIIFKDQTDLQHYLDINLSPETTAGLFHMLLVDTVLSYDEQTSTKLKDTLIKLWHKNLLSINEPILFGEGPPIQNKFSSEIKKQNNILTDLTQVVELIMQSEHENDTKVNLIELYQKEDQIFERFAELLIPLAEKIRKLTVPLEKDLAKNFEHKFVSGNLLQILSQYIRIDVSSQIKIKVVPQLIQTNSISFSYSDSDDSTLYIRPGIYSLELLAEKDQTDLTLQFITETTQMLSDPTRLKAIYLLQQESMYLKQLADALDISSATMSHHIQNLINSELVSMDVQGKNRRIYYKLNQQTFEKLADEIKKIAEVSKSLT